MNSELFIEKIKLYVRDASIENTITKFKKPPGRNPKDKDVLLSEWYNNLSMNNKEVVSEVVGEAIDEALFSFLTVLDGVSVIEDQKVKGKLEVKYINGKNEVILNDSETECLHDLYNILTNKE